MENKNKGNSIKIVIVSILILTFCVEVYLIAFNSLSLYLEKERFGKQQGGQPEKTVLVHLTGLGDFFLRNTGKGYVGMRPVTQQTGKSLIMPEQLSAARKDVYRTLNSDTPEGVQLRNALGLESGKKINVQPDTPVGSRYVDPETSSFKTNTGREVNVPNAEQAVRIEEATNAVRLAERSAAQVEKDTSTSWSIAKQVDDITGSPFAADGSPIRGYGGSFGDNLIAGSSKLERWNAETGRWEEIVMPDSVKARFGMTPGDMDMGVTSRASNFEPVKMLNEKTGEMFDGLRIPESQFQQIRSIPEVSEYFGKGLDEVPGYLPAYSKVGNMEHEFWRVTSADGTMQTAVLDPFSTTLPSRTVFAGATKPEGFLVGEGTGKIGKFNEYMDIREAANRTGYFENGVLKPYSDVVEQRTREYLESHIASLKDNPAELAKFRDQYSEIMNDTRFSPEFRQWVKESTEGLFPESTKVAESPYTQEFMKAATPVSLSELGKSIFDSVFQNDTPEAREQMANIEPPTAEQMAGVGVPFTPEEIPAGMDFSQSLLGRMYNSIFQKDTPEAKQQMVNTPALTAEQELGLSTGEVAATNPALLSQGSLTWGQIANLGINGAFVWDPLLGIPAGEIAELAIDGKRGPYDVNSEAYRKLTQPEGVGSWPKDPSHPLNSPAVKAIMEGRQADSGGCGGDRGENVPVDTGGAREVDPCAGDRSATGKPEQKDFWTDRQKLTPEAYEQARAVAQNADVPPEAVAQQSSPVQQIITDDPGSFQNNPSQQQPVPTAHVATSSPTAIANYVNSISGNGSDKAPFSIRSDTPEGRELIDKLYEVDPKTGEVSLRDDYKDTLKGLRGNLKLNDSEEVYDVKMEKGEITPEQKAEFILSDSGKTKVPKGTKVKNKENNEETTASSDPQNSSQSSREVDQQENTVSTN